MKRIKSLIAVGVVAALSASCSDYLDKEVDLSLDEEQVFSKFENTRGFLANIYTYLPDAFVGYTDGQFRGASRDCMTDNAISFWNVHYYHSVLTDAYSATNHPFAEYFWENDYKGIRAANRFLNGAKESVVKNTATGDDDDHLYDRYVAEARLLRAIFHFDLICYFGDIAIVGDDEDGVPILHEFTNYEAMNQPRTSAAEALQWVADESINWGRVNGAAAYALKSRALLYLASPLNNTSGDVTKWRAAATAATDFITKNAQQSNPYKLYTTEPSDPSQNYYQCFVSTPHLNNEYILSRSEWSTYEIELFLAPCGFSGKANSTGRTNPTQNFVDCYETLNGLPIDQDPTYDEQNPYANRDPRLEQTILHHGSIWGDAVQEEEREVDVTYGSGKDWHELHGGTATGYYTKKFLNNMSFKSPSAYTHACPIFRYAEVLLNAAEAINEAYGPADAYQYVNLVRARVGMPDYKNMTQAQLRERIRNERRIELCFEDHRFFDERRWKIFEGVTTSNEKSKPMYQQVLNLYGVTVTPDAANVFNYGAAEIHSSRVFNSPKNYYFPIPDAEVKRLPALGQNKGWELN
jgi:hypothetical protein